MKRLTCLILVLILAIPLLGCQPQKLPAAPTPTSSSNVQPVDVNGDGVIDENDVLLLLGQADQYWDQNIEPLMAKAGLDTSETGQLPDPSKLQKLTPAEQDQLLLAVDQYSQLEEQLLATAKEARKNK